MICQIYQTVEDIFSVIDAYGSPVSGIPICEFKTKLYEPLGYINTIPVKITELSDGNYKISFAPDKTGLWYLMVIHDKYFSSGKANVYQVFQETFNAVSETLDNIKLTALGRWRVTANSNEIIFYKEDNQTEIARFKLENCNRRVLRLTSKI
ncbi:MAG: hypothetical protein HQK79_20195 [Desulfobacterales bacterium]|nr:hypothetical protein [Desulfobacterales bacterium]